MDKINKLPILTSVVALVAVQHAGAVEPASVEVGSMSLTPTISVSTGYTDNLFDDSENETSTWVTRIRPSAKLEAVSEKLTVGVRGGVEQGIYHSSSADNYTDKSLAVYSNLQFDSRTKLDLLAEYLKKHDERSDSGSGDALTTDQATKPSRYTEKSLGATFTYGSREAKGQIVINPRYTDKEYDNLRAFTRSKDRSTARINGTFFYRVASKTRTFIEGRYTDIDYKSSASTRNSASKQLFLGVEWEATAKTTGIARLGYARKNFDNSAREDFSGSNWEVGLNWEPRTYSVFQLSGSHAIEESSGSADYIDTTGVTLAWLHDWNQRVSSNVSYAMLNEDYVRSNDGREDDTGTLTLGLDYDFRRWLSLGLDLKHTRFDSNLNGLDYTSNDIFLSLQGSL